MKKEADVHNYMVFLMYSIQIQVYKLMLNWRLM